METRARRLSVLSYKAHSYDFRVTMLLSPNNNTANMGQEGQQGQKGQQG